jgi:hypothetical protein
MYVTRGSVYKLARLYNHGEVGKTAKLGEAVRLHILFLFIWVYAIVVIPCIQPYH